MVPYVLVSLFIVPPLAKTWYNRIPLPMVREGNFQPLNFITCILNRHYVRSSLLVHAKNVANRLEAKHPGTVMYYLDANFPFINGFPLPPHLSHNDGVKLDLAFCYKDQKTGVAVNASPSWMGYGVCEEPRAGEENMSELCEEKGYWHYSFLKVIMPQGGKEQYALDEERTRELVSVWATEGDVEKVFIEPHLKTRLRLKSDKIRFHGCQAVRHDDHLHIQLRKSSWTR